MSTLLLRLAAPMQAWGVDSKFETRTTGREPTKSGVLGMLAAALGIRRNDIQGLEPLTTLRFGVRVDQEGKMLRDFHTAHSEKSSYVTSRYYLCDAIFLCGLESDDRNTLESYAYALTHPEFPIFLGRRSCPPTLPVVLGIRDANLQDALTDEPRMTDSKENLRLVIEADVDDKRAAWVKDVPLSFSQARREYGYRKYQEVLLPGFNETAHDPFAELEAKDVSD